MNKSIEQSSKNKPIKIPAMRRHRGVYDRAYVRDPLQNGRVVYLGAFGSDESLLAYNLWVENFKKRKSFLAQPKRRRAPTGFCGCGAPAKKKGFCVRCYCEKRNRLKGHKPHKYKGTTLLAFRPDIAKELVHQFIGERETPGSNVSVDWKCEGCGNIWCSTIKGRVFGGRKCDSCNKPCFDKDSDGILYLIRRDSQFKIGIMNVCTNRMETHARNGWVQIDKVFGSGHDVARLEIALLRSIRSAGVRMGSDAFGAKFDGYTEAWQAVDLEVTSIDDLLKKLGTSFEALLAC